jgi:hypothetical protein
VRAMERRGGAYFYELDTTKLSLGSSHFSCSIWVNHANATQGGAPHGTNHH